MGKCKCNNCDCNIIHEDNVLYAKQKMLNDDLLISMADFYKALSDSTRLKIISFLTNQKLCVCDISALLNMTKSAVSHQLQNLKEMNLIKGERKGKEIFYSLADKHVKEVFEICLTHVLEGENEEES